MKINLNFAVMRIVFLVFLTHSCHFLMMEDVCSDIANKILFLSINLFKLFFFYQDESIMVGCLDFMLNIAFNNVT